MTENEMLLRQMFDCKGRYPHMSVGWLKEEFFKQKVLIIPEGVKIIKNRIIAPKRTGKTSIYPETEVIVLPDGVEEIESWAFASCGGTVKKVYIPKSVKTVGDIAFRFFSGSIYCEDEPKEGWIDKEPEIELHIYQGGAVYEEEIRTYNNWNPENRPVITGVKKEDFLKMIEEENG